ncbi:CotH kinase family protein [uncultured Proteiniphilum sp.]|uniref:CotH kinase family protein n=1 Tax=uncultured Proteiniphilum sp. TaxID=497637 RepID=UPI00260FACD6|nr:CotH kinase family protein [uncultured Proteiniphilum sp.]
MQKMFLKALPFFIFLFIASGCKEEPFNEEIPLNSDNELLEYKLEASLNSGLSNGDIKGKIERGKIELKLPYGLDVSELIATFSYKGKEVLVGGKEQISGTTPNNFSNAIIYTIVAEDGSRREYTVAITYSSPIPHVYITTENGTEITSKDDYLSADISIEANGWGEDYSGETQIKGRGNSTWGMPKKPYRLKLEKKASLLDLAEEKDWVLLANYIDPTLMLNSVAFKIAQLIGLQFTNHAIPVDLTLNGKYVGSYLFTEQVELSSSRVNIDDKKGVLLELDTNFDEDFKFTSNNYRLPVMVKDPDVESDEHFQQIKSDFHQLEDALVSESFPNNNYKDIIDIESVVKYLIIYNLTHNMEINHPKSIYLYKDAGGKYTMGPIWDFDWAYDYEGKQVHFGAYTTPLFRKFDHSPATGYTFFSRFLEDPEVMQLYRDTWSQFHVGKKGELLGYIDWYAGRIKESQKKDHQLWKNGTSDFEGKVRQLKQWLEGRFHYMDEETLSP